MNCQSERDISGDICQHVWALLIDNHALQDRFPNRRPPSSNEITTSQLGKLFPNADERTRDAIDLYGPLALADENGFVVAHLGQSLDGRIAALNGASQWITGKEDVIHNHRMRALSDAVVVGAGTVRHDDPKLTVRGIAGRSPVRVVIDPDRRLDHEYQVFLDDEVETLLMCRESVRRGYGKHGKAEIIGLPDDDLSPATMLASLRERGLKRIFVEGGGMTVSRFLEAGCLDRLQIAIAPMILGSGRPAITLPEIDRIADGLKPKVRRFVLGEDVLFECCFDGRD